MAAAWPAPQRSQPRLRESQPGPGLQGTSRASLIGPRTARLVPEPGFQFGDPRRNLLIRRARDREVALVRFERTLRLLQIQIAQHTKIEPGDGVVRIDRDGALVRFVSLFESTELAIDDAELVEGDCAVGLALERTVERL